ncbi:universal stress protein A [Rufibacter glacialis]|nr:glycosyltransferase family 8 protein [Rufibacter glacialis]GGK56613.1 universal stress protein A [Rufibacter glacialis]
MCVCDDHYFVLLAALVKSIEVNHITSEHLLFYIVEDSVSEQNRNKLLASIDETKTSLRFVKMEEFAPKNVKLPVDTSSYPSNIYMRLFIPYFLPKEMEKVIYLDVDMIVLKDISILWHQEMGKNIIAAVQDPWVKIVSRWGGVENYQEFNLQEQAKYFNTGLLIMDLKKWRDNDVTTKVIRCVNENKEHAHFPDQYGLNVVLANDWMELDPLWNCFAYHEGHHPYLIHFSGRKPIYRSYNFKEEYRAIFFEYLKMTRWSEFRPIGETKRYLKKLSNFINKLGKFKSNPIITNVSSSNRYKIMVDRVKNIYKFKIISIINLIL